MSEEKRNIKNAKKVGGSGMSVKQIRYLWAIGYLKSSPHYRGPKTAQKALSQGRRQERAVNGENKRRTQRELKRNSSQPVPRGAGKVGSKYQTQVDRQVQDSYVRQAAQARKQKRVASQSGNPLDGRDNTVNVSKGYDPKTSRMTRMGVRGGLTPTKEFTAEVKKLEKIPSKLKEAALEKFEQYSKLSEDQKIAKLRYHYDNQPEAKKKGFNNFLKDSVKSQQEGAKEYARLQAEQAARRASPPSSPPEKSSQTKQTPLERAHGITSSVTIPGYPGKTYTLSHPDEGNIHAAARLALREGPDDGSQRIQIGKESFPVKTARDGSPILLEKNREYGTLDAISLPDFIKKYGIKKKK